MGKPVKADNDFRRNLNIQTMDTVSFVDGDSKKDVLQGSILLFEEKYPALYPKEIMIFDEDMWEKYTIKVCFLEEQLHVTLVGQGEHEHHRSKEFMNSIKELVVLADKAEEFAEEHGFYEGEDTPLPFEFPFHSKVTFKS